MANEDLSRLKIDRSGAAAITRHRKRPRLISALVTIAALILLVIFYIYTDAAVEVETATVTTAYPSQSFTLLNATGYGAYLDNAAVDEAWTLVHATHLVESELAGIAASKAVVALCPSTEANLGDGVFPLRDFIARGGRFGIGSDSNVSVSPVEELRWLRFVAGKYSMRPIVGTRTVIVGAAMTSTRET